MVSTTGYWIDPFRIALLLQRYFKRLLHELKELPTVRHLAAAGWSAVFLFVFRDVVPGVLELVCAFADVAFDLVTVDIELDAGFAIGVLDTGNVVPIEEPAGHEEYHSTEEQKKDKVPHQSPSV